MRVDEERYTLLQKYYWKMQGGVKIYPFCGCFTPLSPPQKQPFIEFLHTTNMYSYPHIQNSSYNIFLSNFLYAFSLIDTGSNLRFSALLSGSTIKKITPDNIRPPNVIQSIIL